MMTAFPAFTPQASMASTMPLVLLFTASAYGTCTFAANSCSKASASLPVVSQPLCSTRSTASSSSFPMDALKKGTFNESQSAIIIPRIRIFELLTAIPAIIDNIPRRTSGITVPNIYASFFSGSRHVQYGFIDGFIMPNSISLK